LVRDEGKQIGGWKRKRLEAEVVHFVVKEQRRFSRFSFPPSFPLFSSLFLPSCLSLAVQPLRKVKETQVQPFLTPRISLRVCWRL